ncbi:hypothetical protein D3C75_429950 [compost metagenome]|jgi:hypothetical protein
MEARSKGLILPTNLVRSSLLLNHIEKGHSEEPLCPFSICNPSNVLLHDLHSFLMKELADFICLNASLLSC